MKIHFLGSSSSEGIPNPFCRCDLCLQAHAMQGKDIRTRSSALVDDILLIDMAPEFSYQVMRDAIDATKITDLLFTHTHADHFNVGELFSRMEGFGHHIEHPLTITGNDRAINGCLDMLPNYSRERFRFICPPPFTTVEHRGYRITPLLANHAPWEFCYVYFIEKEGKTIFYGHDSGWFPEATWQWLEGKHADLIVLECTYGFNQNARSDNHMSIETIFAAQQRLQESQALHPNGQIVISHISHNVNLLHHQLVGLFDERNIKVAFDGLKIEI
ncbi:TPA: MBL fold metallo-hydrolase [Serratia marcescens]